MQILGSCINLARARVAAAVLRRDAAEICRLAEAERAAGAEGLDLNLGLAPPDGAATMAWLVQLLPSGDDRLLSLDCADLATLSSGTAAASGPLLLNSASLDDGQLWPRVDLALAAGAGLVLLPLRLADGPSPPESRAAMAATAVARLGTYGLAPERLVVDILVQPLVSRPDAADLAVESLRAVRAAAPRVATIAGIANLSYRLEKHAGLMLRRRLMTRLDEGGLDYAIANPRERSP